MTLFAKLILLISFGAWQLIPFNGFCREIPGIQGKITAIAETGKCIWVGTDNGLWKINKKSSKREHMTTANSLLPSNEVTGICLEGDGNIWVGTTAGILRYDNFAFYVLTERNSNLPDNSITSLTSDNSHNIWIGTASGGLVEKLYCGRFIVYNTRNSKLQNDHIYSITPDINGNVWIGLYNEGLAVIQNGKWATLDSKSGFEGKNISFVSESEAGYSLYCGDGSIYDLRNKTITKRDVKTGSANGLPLRYANDTALYWLFNGNQGVVVISQYTRDKNNDIQEMFCELKGATFDGSMP